MVGSRVVAALQHSNQLRDDLQRLNASLEARVDERTRALAVARDQALHEAQQSLEREAMLSHELRTPLVAIQGHLQLLDQGGLDGRQQQRIETVRTAAQSLTDVLDGLMLLSRAELELPAAQAFSPGGWPRSAPRSSSPRPRHAPCGCRRPARPTCRPSCWATRSRCGRSSSTCWAMP